MTFFCKKNQLLLLVIFLACGNGNLAFARETTNGPLKVHSTNPRYFADVSGQVVYLTGSHSWDNLRDWEPIEFDFDRYLLFLKEKNHNFIRLWAWDLPQFDATAHYDLKADNVTPFPWVRTGPGSAVDGRLKFDLKKFNPAFFNRLRERVKAAGAQGVYVSIMLFEGWNAYRLEDARSRNTHPFIGSNNINGIDVSGNRIYSLDVQEAVNIQEAYVRKVIDTVNDLDNVLYEIANEAHPGSKDWQYHMIYFIKNNEKEKLHQHPVGMTYFGGNNFNAIFFESPADWISPGSGTYYGNPPASDGRKVLITDSDHLYPLKANHPWVWKSFCRGMNVILMDSFTVKSYGTFERSANAGNERSRAAMGHAKSIADRMALDKAVPRDALSSTGYCLAVPGQEYLVYQPKKGGFTVDLKPGNYQVEWIHPVSGKTVQGEAISSKGGLHSFCAKFNNDSVLYLKRLR